MKRFRIFGGQYTDQHYNLLVSLIDNHEYSKRVESSFRAPQHGSAQGQGVVQGAATDNWVYDRIGVHLRRSLDFVNPEFPEEGRVIVQGDPYSCKELSLYLTLPDDFRGDLVSVMEQFRNGKSRS